MSESRLLNEWGEPRMMDQGFKHPSLGKYKDQPEAWWKGRKVHLYIQVDVDGAERQIPIWMDFVRFDDDIVDGRPCRLGIGRMDNGRELPFGTDEVFDVTEPRVEHEGIYIPLASV